MDKPKCTIISPCFNGEEYLENFLESLFIQTYTNVEFIFVNDGSTDKTEHIYYKYKTKLEDKGWTCKYIYQNNAGQAQAINTALKYVSGKYLIWPDSDDILYKNHIQEKIEFMEKNKEYGIAYCFIDDVYANNLDKIVHVRNIIPDNKGFKNIL